MLTLIIAQALTVVLGVAVLIARRFGQVETYSISTCELPNVAADLGTTGTDRARL
jgi:hypothetical protein